jgi:hypothetical protein
LIEVQFGSGSEAVIGVEEARMAASGPIAELIQGEIEGSNSSRSDWLDKFPGNKRKRRTVASAGQASAPALRTVWFTLKTWRTR